MFEWKQKASNAILLDDNVGGKGKCFRAKFLQPGLVKYSFGVCLLNKEIIDRFAYQFEGCPVIIDHKDVTTETAKDDRVGVISKVWFNEFDSWYWCEGVIFDQEALNLIDKGFNVSCQYEITEYSENRENKLHNGNEYDKTILNGRPEHLAIVENPRYENAMIAVNAMEIEEMKAINEEKKEFVTIGEGESAHTIPVDYLKKDNKETSTKQAAEKEKSKKNKYHDFMKNKINNNWYKNAKIDYGVEGKLLDTSLKDDTLTITWEEKEPEKEKKTYKMDIPYASDYTNQQLYNIWSEQDYEAEEITTKNEEKSKKQEATQLKLKLQNDIIQAINEIKETDMFKNLFGKKEKKMEKDEIKAIFLECLTELKASNEAEKEDIKEKEEAENKCKNEEEPDYKKLYEELKAKMEAANEEEEKKEEKEAENKKAKNSIDEQMAMFCKEIETGKSDYVSKAKAIELGSELF